jgi:hypothetical protein
MAAELLTPTDHLSGMPHPIIPTELSGDRYQPGITNHHANHPAWWFRNKEPRTLEDYARIAWRLGRMQYTPDIYHNNGPKAYHDFYVGPPRQSDPDTVFVGLTLTTAGYVHDHGIDLSSGEPVERPMEPREVEHLRATDGLGLRWFSYDYDAVRRFYERYALERGLGQVASAFLHEFIDPATNAERRRYLGHFILAQAVEGASDTVREPYKQALKSGLLHPGMPPAPHALIRYKLGPSERRARLFPLLRQRVTLQLAAA